MASIQKLTSLHLEFRLEKIKSSSSWCFFCQPPIWKNMRKSKWVKIFPKGKNSKKCLKFHLLQSYLCSTETIRNPHDSAPLPLSWGRAACNKKCLLEALGQPLAAEDWTPWKPFRGILKGKTTSNFANHYLGVDTKGAGPLKEWCFLNRDLLFHGFIFRCHVSFGDRSESTVFFGLICLYS